MSVAIRDRIARHVEAAYPEEACGALFGLEAGRSHPLVTTAFPLPNRSSCKHEGFCLEPGELEQACRARRALGESLIGFYHSHPDGGAMPSAADVEMAVPGLWQVTIRVVGGRSGARRAWRAEGTVACRK